ncbi:hypothetical protein QA601_01775 [Chitinispirillales bacterium ANBcel5]|uniref:hypothetical protein n=1 Tax=Cellulosispirillum alkaliphilum TaxID=3039283 RepID=UPI002A4F59D8|nr:hypothetical protein [Chitinispirillales bacterium ANBcel5]
MIKIVICIVIFTLWVKTANAQTNENVYDSLSSLKKGCDPVDEFIRHFLIPQIIKTDDGGYLIVAGGKVQLFDPFLNLKKEVELKPDLHRLQQLLNQIREITDTTSN